MSTSFGNSTADIVMPTPFGFAPPPSAHWDPENRFDVAVESTGMLRDLWAAKRPGHRKIPSLIHFDSLELRPWFDNILVIDVDRDVHGGRSYVYQSIGPGAAVIEGGDFSGRTLLDALPPAQAAPREQLFDRAIRTRLPIEVHSCVEMIGGGVAKWDVVVLPLARDGLRADHLMALAYVEEVG